MEHQYIDGHDTCTSYNMRQNRTICILACMVGVTIILLSISIQNDSLLNGAHAGYMVSLKPDIVYSGTALLQAIASYDVLGILGVYAYATDKIDDKYNQVGKSKSMPGVYNEMRLYMLDLINMERSRAGLDPVVLGYNTAAQRHADSMLQNCFAGHWGINGLKPYMRYSLAGGYHPNGENVSGLEFCIEESHGYLPKGPLPEELEETMEGFMNSPGHRANILNPHNYAVNIGLAWDSYNIKVVQHFESNYVRFIEYPDIRNGVLTMSGSAVNSAALKPNNLQVQIYYDPTPHVLTLGQTSRTFCYNFGEIVTALRPPLDAGYYYTTDIFTTTVGGDRCPDPYDIPALAPAPTSPSDAYQLFLEAVDNISYAAPATNPWTDADVMYTSGDLFEVEADISSIIHRHGSGVYSIVVWGIAHGETAQIAEVALFYDAVLGGTYHWLDDLHWNTFRGKLTRIVNVDTLEIDDKLYRLALIDVPPSYDAAYHNATNIVQNACLPDSIVHVHIDRGQMDAPVHAQVWCKDIHLQSALLDGGHVDFDFVQCRATELKGDWVRCP
ncbi:MAG: CAP domain-containing protein [Cenarchaeum sp. SB0673_bin_9]|nr:CAP domain-containing protein [Cenarchaeum sp. SB0673_bin_9]